MAEGGRFERPNVAVKARCRRPLGEPPKKWHPEKASNPQPLVLETSALPIELSRYRKLESHAGFEPSLRGVKGH